MILSLPDMKLSLFTDNIATGGRKGESNRFSVSL